MMRYERKYRITHSDYERILHHLMSNPVGFNFAYDDRIVNSIYYDDINYTSYNDNVIGNSDRVKYRVRWYGKDNTLIEKPILEKKIKQNQLGTKAYQKIDPFHLGSTWPEINPIVNANHMNPLVIVQYRRTYLESSDHSIRATIDRAVRYFNIDNQRISYPWHDDSALIVEIKHGEKDEAYAAHCMQYIPYRMTKNSKYVSAMAHFLL